MNDDNENMKWNSREYAIQLKAMEMESLLSIVTNKNGNGDITQGSVLAHSKANCM